ncbi:unnamed protein product [Ceratitis capitata]|uniref:(Mediterranean fruit fly) hypothetical protein n=1 Tax=Ceratitis capitata TaxID=7213 RepID=A0A811V6C9_CERCA|nr:unnamed protein product [Ceratitis capitata]
MSNITYNNNATMSDSTTGGDDSVFMRDIIIPCIFLFLMLTANALLFGYILHKRKSVVWEDPSIYQACLDNEQTAKSVAAAATATVAGKTTQEAAVTLEMEQLRQ